MNQSQPYFFDPFQTSPQSPLSGREQWLSFLALYLQGPKDCLLTTAAINDEEWHRMQQDFGVQGNIKVLEQMEELEKQRKVAPKIYNRWFYPHYSDGVYLKLASKVHFTQMMNYLFPTINHSQYMKLSDILKLPYSAPVVLKLPFGQTGQQLWMIENQELWSQCQEDLQQLLAAGTAPDQVVLDPLLARVIDFSIAWTDQGRWIYRNGVDEKGQYRFTQIDSESLTKIDLFLFSQGLKESEVRSFESRLAEIETELIKRSFPHHFYGGMDFFIYRESKAGELKIHPGCEINPRMTMGVVGHLLAQKWGLLDHSRQWLFGFKKPIDQHIRSLESSKTQAGAARLKHHELLAKKSISPMSEFNLSPKGMPTLVLKSISL